MLLSDKQFKFAKMMILLTQWLVNHGYKFTIGEVWRPGDKRCHGNKLAVDINLWVPIYKKSGELVFMYTRLSEHHGPPGEFWESLGGSWGGRFKKRDGNHYSLEHRGVK